MKVQEVILEENKKRYMLLDQQGFPVLSVMKYLKYLDTTGKSSNTQKTYCYSLKHYFTYLQEKEKDYTDVNFNNLVEFVAWLRKPYQTIKVTHLQPTSANRTEKTINLTITVVTNFYDFLYRNEDLKNSLIDKLFKQVFTGGQKKYKDFLYHVNKGNPSNRNILKIREPKKK